MKLHYSSEASAASRLRKIRAVATALGLALEEVAHDATADVSTISHFNTLPLLQTQEGTFFSSNTIVRYLGNSQGKLYGGDNLHNKTLIDQWLDITVCDLEAAVAAVAVAANGQNIDTAKVSEDIHKFLTVLEGQLNGKKFLVGGELSIADLSIAAALSGVFTTLLGEEERKAYPNTTAWYLSIAGSNNAVGSTDLAKEAHKSFKGKKAQKEEKKPVEKKEEKKEEKKPAPAADEDDLFGDDPAPSAPKPKPQPVKPKKEKPAAKSMVVFDVKVYEMETDLNELFKKIKSEITMDGLVWNNEPKILPIAFGMNKLQVGCVVEDAKVSVDDIYEKIEAWDDTVQSIDTVSFQKL